MQTTRARFFCWRARMAGCKTKRKPRRRYSSSRNSRNGRERRVAWRIGPIRMHFFPSARPRSISVCLLVTSALLFPAVGVQREQASTPAFMDVTRASGIDFHLTCGGARKLYIMESMCGGVAFIDYDNDGWPDIYVANDSSPSLLYHNNEGKSFTEVAVTAGVAFSEDGREQAGMGVDFGDYDNDGLPDLVKTNFSDDANNLYHNNGDGTFDDRAGAAGFGAVSVPFLGFGVRFLDYDNDGWKDILVANGHVNPQVDEHAIGIAYAQRALLFHNLRDERFEEVGLRAGPALGQRRVSRGLAVADINNDGALAVLISNLDGSPTLLRNVSKPRGHWINLKLAGTRSNRDAYGARVEIVAGGLKQIDEVRANSSCLSGSDARLHFGLGSATRVDQVVIRWPSGVVEKLESLPVDRETVIREGAGEAMPLQPKR